MSSSAAFIKKIALASVFSALGVVIAPFLWFPFLTTRAFPGQHMVNVIAGVLLGPSLAAIVALFIGIIRNALGIGTIYAFPGGIPGAITVGFAYQLLKKLGKRGRTALFAALFEPVGTVFIGATLTLYLFAPWLGDIRLLSQLEKGPLVALLTLWSGWAVSSVPGSVIGLLLLLVLQRVGITEESLFGER